MLVVEPKKCSTLGTIPLNVGDTIANRSSTAAQSSAGGPFRCKSRLTDRCTVVDTASEGIPTLHTGFQGRRVYNHIQRTMNGRGSWDCRARLGMPNSSNLLIWTSVGVQSPQQDIHRFSSCSLQSHFRPRFKARHGRHCGCIGFYHKYRCRCVATKQKRKHLPCLSAKVIVLF